MAKELWFFRLYFQVDGESALGEDFSFSSEVKIELPVESQDDALFQAKFLSVMFVRAAEMERRSFFEFFGVCKIDSEDGISVGLPSLLHYENSTDERPDIKVLREFKIPPIIGGP
jgi:hypothetical protein